MQILTCVSGEMSVLPDVNDTRNSKADPHALKEEMKPIEDRPGRPQGRARKKENQKDTPT